jgi:transposase-like protein
VTRSNPDSVAAAADVLAAGGTIAQAATQAGVSRRTVERWRDRGRVELADASFARLALEADRVPPQQQGPLSEADLVELLEGQALRGSTRAVELLLRRVSKPASVDLDGDPFREVDQIGEFRRARLQREGSNASR